MRVIAQSTRRPFTITGSLIEGEVGDWSPRRHSIEDVYLAHSDWQVQRGIILGCYISEAECCYGIPRDPDNFEKNLVPAILPVQEAGFILQGWANPLYDANRFDGQLEMWVRSLAEFIADRLGQRRIYLSYRAVSMVLEKGVEKVADGT